MVMIVNDDNFEAEVLKSDKPVVVDFFATWCGPCKMVAPIFEEVEKEMPDIKFVKIDVDASPNVSSKYGIRSVPTFYLFKNETFVSTKIGAITKAQLIELATS